MHKEEEFVTTAALEGEALEMGAKEVDFLDPPSGIHGRCPLCLSEGIYFYNLAQQPSIYYDPAPAFAYNPLATLQSWPWLPAPPGEGGQFLGFKGPACSGFYYTVQYGDSLWALSHRFGVDLRALLAANPHIYDPNFIFAGQIICIPFPPPPKQCRGVYYTVRSGDSLYILSRHYGMSLSTLIQANPQITNPNIIYPGQVICIPRVKQHKPCTGFHYTLRPGDTMAKIGQRFGLHPKDILRANPQITDPDRIYPGQIICIPEGHKGYLYTIQRGDKLFDIASRSNITLTELLGANPEISPPHPFFVGQVIYIPTQAGEGKNNTAGDE